MMNSLKLFSCLLIMLFSFSANAQEVIWEKNKIMDTLIHSIRLKQKFACGASQKACSFYHEYGDLVLDLKKKVMEINVDSPFILSLNADFRKLDSSRSMKNEAYEDLMAKNTINGSELYKKIAITTTDSVGKMINNYMVYWQFWLDKDLPNPRGNFSNPTTPSTGELVPGIYDIYVQKAGDPNRYPRKPIKQTIKFNSLTSKENTEEIKIIIK